MCPDKSSNFWRHARGTQRGFALVTAIFLLVVLASLGAFMVSFSTVQHTTSAQDINGTRVYLAARAGIEWATFQVLRGGPSCTALPLAVGGGLSDVTVNVQCVRNAFTEGDVANNGEIVTITSTASVGGLPGGSSYVERQLQAVVER